MTCFLASKGDEINIWHLVRLSGSAVRRLLVSTKISWRAEFMVLPYIECDTFMQ